MNEYEKTKISVIKGAIVVSSAGLIAKILGALYRIPLTNILQADGLGVYQTVFPIYALLLTLSSSGIPSAISKLISSGEPADKVLAKALSIFLPLGLIGTTILCLLSVPLSSFQGIPEAKYAYIALSPAVTFVSAIACARGYFQGGSDMFPTAASQIVEQAGKLTVGLFLCYLFRADYALAGAAACFGVTISEIIATAYLFFRLKKDNVRYKTKEINYSARKIVSTVFPITLSALLLPIARVFDSFTIINVIGKYSLRAAALYGLYTGSVESVLGVPVALCYGAAISALPQISSAAAKNDCKSAKSKIVEAIAVTIFPASLFSAVIAIFSPLITRILFGGFTTADAIIVSKLLSYSAINVCLLSLVQTASAILIGLNKPYASCLFLGFGLIVKAVVEIIFLNIPEINIFGALYSDISCYLIAIFGELLYIICILKRQLKRTGATQTNQNRLFRNR